MPLAPCRSLLGQAKYIEQDPRHAYVENVLFTGSGLSDYSGSGLFDYRRKMVAGSGEYRGVPVLHLAPADHHQPLTSGIDPARVSEEAPDDLYYWGGILKAHYGHFLVNTLSRLWMYAQLPKPRPKILYWWRDIRAVWRSPFVRAIFEHLDLGPADFVRFERPTRIRRILVPESSFEENHLVHDVYGRFLRSIGDRLAPPSGMNSAAPLYMSRSLLSSGTTCVVNETLFEDRLRRAGFEIFHPEQNDLESQIAAWKGRDLVAGFIGSGLLSSAFTKGSTIAAISYDATVYSNQVLTDLAANNRALYCYPHDDLIALEPTEAFQRNYEFVDPVRTAEDLLRQMENLQRGSPKRREIRLHTESVEANIDDPLGINLSLGRVLQHGIEPVFPVDAETIDAVLSRLWWEVDLEGTCELHEIRLHASGQTLAGDILTILISPDGDGWSEAARPSGAPALGDPALTIYRWRPDRPHRPRKVRVEISLLGDFGFTLKALEVFGEPAPASTRQED